MSTIDSTALKARSARRSYPSSPMARTTATLAGELTSTAAGNRLAAESLQSSAGVQSAAFQAMMQQDGVDSDQQMESLLRLENAYASNAKVLQAVDEMLQTILRMP